VKEEEQDGQERDSEGRAEKRENSDEGDSGGGEKAKLLSKR